MSGLQSQVTLSTPLQPEFSPVNLNSSGIVFRTEGESFGGAQGARYFHAAHVLMANSEYALAQKLLREVLQSAPTSAATVKALAECARRLDRKEERQRLLEALLRIADEPEHHLLAAEAYYEAGQDQQALRHYLHALNGLPDRAEQFFEIYKNVGNIHVRCHDFESAEENYNRAYTLNPRSATLLVNFGTLAVQRGDWDKAIQRFREAVDCDFGSDRAWVGLALAHRQFGDFDLSWANLSRALDLNPHNATALQLGLSWVVKDQRWGLVSGWLQRHLEVKSDDAVMSLALAQLWFLRGDFYGAKLELTRALAFEPHLSGGEDLLRLIEQEEMKRTHGREADRGDLGA